MKSFIQFCPENASSSLEFKSDNPGGQWLKDKQEDAESRYSRNKGTNGATTGYFNRAVKMKTSDIKSIKGVNGEEKYRGDSNAPKRKYLNDEIGHPSNFNSRKNPILIGVNHRGESHVIEGNHRLAYAADNGIQHIHSDIRYFNGGEDAVSTSSPLHPSNIIKNNSDG